jgi:hypothetical protein
VCWCISKRVFILFENSTYFFLRSSWFGFRISRGPVAPDRKWGEKESTVAAAINAETLPMPTSRRRCSCRCCTSPGRRCVSRVLGWCLAWESADAECVSARVRVWGKGNQRGACARGVEPIPKTASRPCCVIVSIGIVPLVFLFAVSCRQLFPRLRCCTACLGHLCVDSSRIVTLRCVPHFLLYFQRWH